jgi:hypothetical protein
VTHLKEFPIRSTRRLVAISAITAAAAVGLASCGDPDAPAGSPGTTGPTVTVPATDPDSPVTSPADPTVPAGEPDIEAARQRAISLLGTPEADLPDDVRVGRRDDEQFALTADLVPGRLTVELDTDDNGDVVVTSVSVESEDGSQLVTTATVVQDAASALGANETALDPSWRIGRRGDEQFALTEDFVVGRYTVELDDDGTGTYVVTAVIVELPGGARTVSEDSLLAEAEALIGAPEAELPETVRVARRGDEMMPLTMDYRVGRFTAELDDDGTGTYVVTAVQVELPEGVQTIPSQP